MPYSIEASERLEAAGEGMDGKAERLVPIGEVGEGKATAGGRGWRTPRICPVSGEVMPWWLIHIFLQCPRMVVLEERSGQMRLPDPWTSPKTPE